MFEGTLFESRGLVASKTQKWTALGSFALQCALAAVLIAIPMIKPEVLPMKVPPPKITIPDLKSVQLVQHAAAAAVSAAAAMTLPSPAPRVENTHSPVFPLAHPAVDSDIAPVSIGSTTMSNGSSSLSTLATIGGSPGLAVAVRPRNTQPTRVSTGVLNGMLLTPISPVYPQIARAAHVEGSLVIEAVISKTGRIESLNVVSGPEMLRTAALDAVRQARYAPYKLNGDPVEVQTVITVVFRLGV